MTESERSTESGWRRPGWIWARSQVNAPNCYVYARRQFSVGRVASARAWVTCASHYRLFVNGRYVGRGPCVGTAGVQYFDEHDLSHVVRRGKNVIAALCHNEGVETVVRPASPGGFACRIEIVSGSGTDVLETDETWRVRVADDYGPDSPRISSSLGFREHYDSGAKPVGWNVVGFDDSKWEDACVVDSPCPHLRLVARPIPLLREREVFPERVVKCQAVEQAEGLLGAFGDAAVARPHEIASVTVDFGHEVVGYPILRIRDGGRAVIGLGYGDSPLHEGDDASRPDRVTLDGGRREWQAFGRRTFRYLSLTIPEADAPLQIESVSAALVGYPVEQVTTFECGDEEINQAWRNGVHDLGLCMQDSYEADPLGDPVQRPQEAQAMALANYHCFFDSCLSAKALREFATAANNDPAWITMLHDYYLYTGDMSLVEELYPSLRPLLTELPPEADHSALRDGAKLATACGAVNDAIRWHELAERARGADARGRAGEPGDSLRELDAMFREGGVSEALDRVRHGVGKRRADKAGAVYFLIADVLGVRPSMPGSPVVVVQPRPGDLAWARGRVQTHKGLVEVEWRSEVDFFEIDIDAPYGFIVALPIGRFENPLVDEIDTSPETPERRAQRTYGWGSTIWRDREEHDPYLDWLEGQEAEPAPDYARRARCSAEGDYLWIRECPLTQARYVVRESQPRG